MKHLCITSLYQDLCVITTTNTNRRGKTFFRGPSPATKKNSTSFDLSIFLFKPQAWYGITRKRVWYRRRRMASPKVHFLRLDSIPSCNGFHTMLCIDSIHAFGVIVTHGFKSVRKLAKISFLSALHNKNQVKQDLVFLLVPECLL